MNSSRVDYTGRVRVLRSRFGFLRLERQAQPMMFYPANIGGSGRPARWAPSSDPYWVRVPDEEAPTIWLTETR